MSARRAACAAVRWASRPSGRVPSPVGPLPLASGAAVPVPSALARAPAAPRPYSSAAPSAEQLASELASAAKSRGSANWVFLGPPGVGKGTYASRVATAMGVPHIAMGDLVRAEIKEGTPVGKEMEAAAASGALVPDSTVLGLLKERLERGKADDGEVGFVLDGFPRTAAQADALLGFVSVDRVINLGLREEVLVEKCCGRRVCGKCGKGWNVADIYVPAGANGEPEIVMPPLNPPEGCEHLMETRPDDTPEVVKARLEVYKANAAPVEEFFRARGLMDDFEITSGIKETMPVLLQSLLDILKR